MQVELVVFDVAGTTVVDENNVAGTLRMALAEVGCAVTESACARVMCLAKPVAIEALAGSQVPRAKLTALVARAHESFVQLMVHHYLTSKSELVKGSRCGPSLVKRTRPWPKGL